MPAALKPLHVIVATAVLTLLLSARAASAPRELRVCADPKNLPFSNQKLEGFENKLADLIAAELRASVTYTWLRQRRGFIRRGLNADECDVVTGIPSASEIVLATKPYYRSTYVFVYRKNENLKIQSFDDPALRQLRVGLHAIGEDGANPPPAHALGRRGIVNNVVGFKMWDVESVENPQGQIIDAVARGEIDVAIVWGPLGGYFARRHKDALEVVPVSPSVEASGAPFVFEIALGVRSGERALKTQLDEILDRRRSDVQRILDQYGVPRVE
jgi:mxaJ protein